MSTDLETTLREAMEWDRKFLGRAQALAEGRLRPPAPPPEVAALIEAVEREVNEMSIPAPAPAPRVPPPPPGPRAPREPAALDFARMAAAFAGRSHIPVPEAGSYARLAEAFSGQGMPASDDYARLARALLGGR
jgi:hypothetical protein